MTRQCLWDKSETPNLGSAETSSPVTPSLQTEEFQTLSVYSGRSHSRLLHILFLLSRLASSISLVNIALCLG